MERSRPSVPLSTSRGRPAASGLLFSRPATVTAAVFIVVTSGFGLDEPEVAVGAAEEHGHEVARRVAEDDHRITAVADFRRGILDGHRLHRVTTNADDPRRRFTAARAPLFAVGGKSATGDLRSRRG